MAGEESMDGWYHDRPARSIQEWNEWQKKYFSPKYDIIKPQLVPCKRRKAKYRSKIVRSKTLEQLREDEQLYTKNMSKKSESVNWKSKQSQNVKSAAKSKMHIFVKTPVSLEQLLVKPSDSVESVKETIAEKLGVLSDDVHLNFGSIRMCKLLPLEDHGVTDECNIEVLLSSGLPGGADRQPEEQQNTDKEKSGTTGEKQSLDSAMKPQQMESELNFFLRGNTARHSLLSACIPCIANVIRIWHESQKSRIGDNIDLVQKEMEWKAAIESQVYPSPNEVNILWGDINISELHKNPLEVAKVFALTTRKSSLSEIGDLDICSLLNILMHFRDIHKGDATCFKLIKEIMTLHSNAMKIDEAGGQSHTQLEAVIMDLVKSLAKKHPQYWPPTVTMFQTEISKVLTDTEFVPYMPVLGASYLVGVQMRPQLIKIFLNWHEEQKSMLKPCSAPQKCSSKPASGTKRTWCKNCKSWVRALRKVYNSMGEDQQPFEKVVDTTRLHTDPVEAMKAFLPDVADSLTHLDDLDAESTWFLLKRFSPILKKSHKVVKLIKNLFAGDCKLFHVSVNRACMEEKLINDTFKTYRDLLTTLHETHPKLFTQEWEDNLASHLDQIQHLTLEGYDIDIKDLTFEDVSPNEKYRRACYKKPTGARIEVSVKRLSSVDKESLYLMKNLKHKNIVQFVGVCHDEHNTYIVTEYADKGDLRSYLQSKGVLPPELVLKWSKEACAALEYLHSRKCVHTDVRPSNFLIMSDNSLKLSSLELVTEWDQTKSHRGTDRTCAYMAPEVIENQFRSMKSDIFSVGMILWDLITGKFPYSNQKGEYHKMNAICGDERPPMPDKCPPKLAGMLESCWKKEYKERPSAESLARDIEGAIKEYFDAQEQPKKEKTAVEDTEDEVNNSATGFQSKPAVSVKVQYKRNTGHSALGLMETLHAILGFLNSAVTGIVHLLVDPKEKNDDPQDFVRELHNLLAARGQQNSYTVHGSHGEDRYISTKPITQMRILATSNAYIRDSTGIREINDTTELIKTSQLEMDEVLPSLPEEFWFLESVEENALYEFKDSSGRDLLTCFNNASVHKYVSAFANSCGGRILFGINDSGIVSGVSGTEKKQEITDAVTKKMKEMLWFHRDEGLIDPVENKHWMLRFVDVNGTPPGPLLRVAVLSVKPFHNGLVFTDSPQCPVWDPKATGGYRNLTFEEWCSDLKAVDIDSDESKAKEPEALSDDESDDLEADSAMVMPSVVTTLETDSAVVKHPLMTSATVDDDSDDLEADSAVVRPSLVTSIETDSAVVKRPLVTSATSSLETDSVVARHPALTTPVAFRHTSSTGTQASAQSTDVPGMTVIPESTEDQKSRSMQLAKKEYMLKTYGVPKEVPTDVDICFTSAPVSEGLQFSSGQIAGALPESSSVRGQRGGIKSDVSIRVKKYVGPMHITVYLVTEEDTSCLHPNRLVGTDCHHGIYSKHVRIKSPGQTISLPNFHISRVARKDVGVELDQRKVYIEQLCPRTPFQTRKSEEYDLSRVKLCVLGYLPDDTKADEFIIPLHPLTSITLCDKGKQVRKEPRIVKIFQTKGPVVGGEKIKLVVVWTKDDFDVLFSLNITDPPSSWQTIADVTESVNQNGRRLVTVRTPAFHKKDITSPTQVRVQVRSGGLYSNALPYTFMPKTDNSVDIKKKVDKRRPVYITHFTDVGAARPDVLEYDEKESRMGLSKRKWKPSTNEDAPHSTENLLAVTKRLPTVIPARPLPKPKQTGSAATSGARPKDSSDGASSNETSEMLRKYKAFASTHGYKKTAQRVEDVKTHYIDSVAEEEKLPPAEEETKELYVSDWVTSTLPDAANKQEEATPIDEAQKKAEDAELKAIALGVDQRSGAQGVDKGSGGDRPGDGIEASGAQATDQVESTEDVDHRSMTADMDDGSSDGSFNTASGEERNEFVSDWVTSNMPDAGRKEEEIKALDKQATDMQGAYRPSGSPGLDQGSTDGSYNTADCGSKNGEEVLAEHEKQPRHLQEIDENMGESGEPKDGSNRSDTMLMKGNHEDHTTSSSTLVEGNSGKSKVALLDLDWRNSLGMGKYGKVFHAVWNQMDVAARILPRRDDDEIRILSNLKHPNIVSVLGLAERSEDVYIITEYMQCGTLRKMLSEVSSLTSRTCLSLVSQAAHGLAFLHDNQIVHGDVGTHHCFLRKEELKVRILQLDNRNTRSVDVEMFGNLLVEVLFADKSKGNKAGAESRPEIPSTCPLNLKELIQSCLEESTMQSMTDVDEKLGQFVSKWQNREDWSNLEEMDEYEDKIQLQGEGDSTTEPSLDVKIISGNSKEDSGILSSSAHLRSIQSQFPMKAPPDIFSSDAESGMFENASPSTQISHSPYEITTDYHSPRSTQPYAENESGSSYSDQIAETITADMTKREFHSLEGGKLHEADLSEAEHHSSLPERRGFSLPLKTNAVGLESHPDSPSELPKSMTSQNPSITKLVGIEGDCLTLEGLGISLNIPSGALEEPTEITLSVVSKRKLPDLEEQESNVCPVVRCLPSGLQFRKPVMIRMPHCGVLPEDRPVTANVHCNQEDEDDPPNWQTTTGSSDSYPRTDIHHDHLLLSVLHFTEYFITIKGIEMKKMKMAAFVSEVCDDWDQEIRVYLHNDTLATQQAVCQEEELIEGSTKKGPSKPYRIHPSSKGFIFQLSRPKIGWIVVSDFRTKKIDYESVWYEEFVNAQFTLENKGNVNKFRCKITGQQEENSVVAEIEITNPVKKTIQENQAQPQQSMHVSATPPPAANGFIYRQGSITERHTSTVADGALSYTEQHETTQVEVANQVPMRTQLSSPHDTSMESVNSTSLPSVEYDQYYQPILPYNLLRNVCSQLDCDHPLGDNWKRLAGHFGLDGYISCLERGIKCDKSPTHELIKSLQSRYKVNSYRDLIEALKRIDRPDIVNMIEENIAKYEAQMNDRSQLPTNISVLGGEPKPALKYPMQGSYTPARVPNGASQHVPPGQLQISSPPAASTPGQSPDTPGSGTATMPEEPASTAQAPGQSPRFPRRRLDTTSQNQSHVTQRTSLGPTNVHPQEDDSGEDELQADGVTTGSTLQDNINRNNNSRGVDTDSNRNEISNQSEVIPVNHLAERLDNTAINAS